MSDTTEILSTIDDYLISIADGLRYASDTLSRADAGHQGVRYYVPKLDFELRMTLKVVEDTSLSTRYRRDAASAAGDRHLTFSPVTPEVSGRSNFSAEIVSTLRGSFVAVPANDGLPAPRLALRVDADDPRAVRVEALLRDAAGKALPGVEVEFNLDRDDSATLSQATVGAAFALAAGTALDAGVATSGADGVASAILRVDPAQAAGSQLVVVVDALSLSETHVHQVRA